MVTIWGLRVPIDIKFAEGPDAFLVIEDAKARCRKRAREAGLDADQIIWGWETPERRAGHVVPTYDPVMGVQLSPMYALIAEVER